MPRQRDLLVEAGTSIKRMVILIRLEVTEERASGSFLGMGRAGNSAGSAQSCGFVKLFSGTIQWSFRKKTCGRSLVTGRSVRN